MRTTVADPAPWGIVAGGGTTWKVVVPVPWLWTDELAARLAGTGLVDDERLDAWTANPLALRIPDPDDE